MIEFLTKYRRTREVMIEPYSNPEFPDAVAYAESEYVNVDGVWVGRLVPHATVTSATPHASAAVATDM
jgi:hypothetical protein